MAVCANSGRMYMGTARQYMENQCNCKNNPMNQRYQNISTSTQCGCEKGYEKEREQKRQLVCRDDGCHPESMCMDLPLAMAYMNPQPYTGLVECEIAFERGSAFNNLYDPWNPGKYC